MGVRFSVIVPTYNGAPFVGMALESVLAQTRPPAEILVIDDVSTDSTEKIVADMARSASIPIRWHRLLRNSGGPAKPINFGLATATGEAAAVLDQDDQFAPDWLRAAGDILDHHADIDLVLGTAGRMGEPGTTVIDPSVLDQVRASAQAEDAFLVLKAPSLLASLLLLGCFPVGYPGFAFRRSRWTTEGPVDESLRIASDYDFLMRLAASGDAAWVDRITYLRREHDQNASHSRITMTLECCRLKARHWARAGQLREDPRLRAELAEWFQGAAYWLRQGGAHAAAWECHRLAHRAFGADWANTIAAAKVAAHWIASCFGRQDAINSDYTMATARNSAP